MKKIMVLMLIMAMCATNALAWKMEIFGYTLQTRNVEVVDYLQDAPEPQETPQISTNAISGSNPATSLETPYFEQEVAFLNSQGQVQMALKELGYSRIGLVNTDDGRAYTAYIGDDGTISEVRLGTYQPEVTISGSLSGIEEAVDRGDYNSVLNHVDIPFSVKMKLLVMKIL